MVVLEVVEFGDRGDHQLHRDAAEARHLRWAGVALLSAIYAVQVIVKTLIIGNSVAGYPSLMTVVLFLGGVQLMFLGVIGEYLGRVFNETKQRPLYLVERYVPSAVKVSA
jgi:polyisoprenyl-phosphate glycosyltransferase